MSDVICVTNRSLCRDVFLSRIEEAAKLHPAGILLREKELDEEEYKKLASQVLRICKKHRVTCILHNFADVAEELGAEALHLPLTKLRELSEAQRKNFRMLGASCHSVEEAREALELGCTYLIAGHIFATDCKKGLPGRGTEFLKSVCESVQVPVYAIGGISNERMSLIREAGANGGCIMSGWMQCADVEEYLAGFDRKERKKR